MDEKEVHDKTSRKGAIWPGQVYLVCTFKWLYLRVILQSLKNCPKVYSLLFDF